MDVRRHPGYIERRYNACAEDMGSGANNTEKTGDQCWETDNASLSLSGHAGELIKDGSNASRWHLRADDGTFVAHKAGGPSGDDDGEWWLVRTTDGTKPGSKWSVETSPASASGRSIGPTVGCGPLDAAGGLAYQVREK